MRAHLLVLQHWSLEQRHLHTCSQACPVGSELLTGTARWTGDIALLESLSQVQGVLQGIRVHVMSGDAPSVVARYASLAGIPASRWCVLTLLHSIKLCS